MALHIHIHKTRDARLEYSAEASRFKTGYWRSSIRYDGRELYLGADQFPSRAEAIENGKRKAKELYPFLVYGETL